MIQITLFGLLRYTTTIDFKICPFVSKWDCLKKIYRLIMLEIFTGVVNRNPFLFFFLKNHDQNKDLSNLMDYSSHFNYFRFTSFFSPSSSRQISMAAIFLQDEIVNPTIDLGKRLISIRIMLFLNCTIFKNGDERKNFNVCNDSKSPCNLKF